MINVTISMDEVTARWVRVEAAKAGLSVSRWLGGLLAERRQAQAEAGWEAGREARQAAMRAFLDRPRALAGLGLSKPSRATANAAFISRTPMPSSATAGKPRSRSLFRGSGTSATTRSGGGTSSPR